MIDTNELRKIANNTDLHGSKIYCSSIALWMEAVADELDRLYEIERRNTPLTQEQIEAELVIARGFESNDSSRIDLFRKTDCGCCMTERAWETGESLAFILHRKAYSLPLSAVTLQLLDAVLEAK